MLLRGLAAVACLVFFSQSAQAAQLCAWLVETQEPDEHKLVIWLKSDAELDFLYKVGGRGIVTPGNTGNSPGSGTFTLHAGKADSPWSYGQTLEPPGQIDETIEIHRMPADIFSDAPTPLLAKFVFKRDVPASETIPPATLARKQCATIKMP